MTKEEFMKQVEGFVLPVYTIEGARYIRLEDVLKLKKSIKSLVFLISEDEDR